MVDRIPVTHHFSKYPVNYIAQLIKPDLERPDTCRPDNLFACSQWCAMVLQGRSWMSETRHYKIAFSRNIARDDHRRGEAPAFLCHADSVCRKLKRWLPFMFVVVPQSDGVGHQQVKTTTRVWYFLIFLFFHITLNSVNFGSSHFPLYWQKGLPCRIILNALCKVISDSNYIIIYRLQRLFDITKYSSSTDVYDKYLCLFL